MITRSRKKGTKRGAPNAKETSGKRAATRGKKAKRSPDAEKKYSRADMDKLVAMYTCPVNHELIVDPVTTEKGVLHERATIEEQITRGQSSLTSDKLLPCVAAKQVIEDLVVNEAVSTPLLFKYYVKRGMHRSLGKNSSEVDLTEALSDFVSAAKYAETQESIENLKYKIRLITWAIEGLEVCSNISGKKWSDEDHRWFNSIVTDSLPRSVLGNFFLEKCLATFKHLEKGTLVRIIDSATKLQALCERAPSGYDEGDEVGWASPMSSTAGKVGKVKESSKSSGSYDISFVVGGETVSHWYPYDAISLV